jgi:hypothetical protein
MHANGPLRPAAAGHAMLTACPGGACMWPGNVTSGYRLTWAVEVGVDTDRAGPAGGSARPRCSAHNGLVRAERGRPPVRGMAIPLPGRRRRPAR